MIKVDILPGKTLSSETIVFNLYQGKLEFPSHLEARRWQFNQIFGEDPDFGALEGYQVSYIFKIFDLENDFSTNLVEADPCRIAHLQRLSDAIGRKIVVENYLVAPTY